MAFKPAHIIAAALAVTVMVAVLATPLCIATACTTDMHRSMASTACARGDSLGAGSCDHVLRSMPVTAVIQSPAVDLQVAAAPAPPVPAPTVQEHVAAHAADEPPRQPAPSPLRM